MAVTIEQVRPQDEPDRFGFSLFLAIAIHALLIFGIGFKLYQQQAPAPTLEVTLAQHRSDQAPTRADFLAQHNQQGSGNQHQTEELTTDQQPELIDSQLKKLGAQPVPMQQRASPGATPVISTVADSTDLASDKLEKDTSEASETPPKTAATQLEFASLKAKLDEQQRLYSKLPKVLRVTSASTMAAEHATYLRYWIDRIELVGNRNYPEEARRKGLYGDLRMAVTLLPDGSVEGVEILLSSGQRVLDQAAVRTVRLASPFAQFPAEMRQWDKLEIIRTWRFEAGHRLNTSN
ncbi:energy transducer TonB family protein [Porticoccus sp.]